MNFVAGKFDAENALWSGISWYDYICPFCYVGQARTRILTGAGLRVVQIPFQVHPETPVEGAEAGVRPPAMVELLEREARSAGLVLNWPSRIPNSRLALTAAEWTRQTDPARFPKLHEGLFGAHFISGEDLGDPAVVDDQLSKAGLDRAAFWTAMDDGTAEQAVDLAEAAGRSMGVHGTPTWLIAGCLISGLPEESEFKDIAARQQERVS